MSFSYSNLLMPNSGALHEKASSYSYLSERHIQAIWFEQKYFKNLTTTNGETIQILSPGLWNSEAGPDFMKGHFIIGSREYRGDIEIHLHEDNWYDHKHDKDPRYNNVCLHISFWNTKNKKSIVKENGESPHCVHLENFMTIPQKRVMHYIDIDLYPYKKHKGSGKCAQKLFNQLSDSCLSDFFLSAAHWRLEQKKQFLEMRFQTLSHQVLAGIAMALGYKHNTEAFLDLFAFLLPQRDLPEEELLAIALGVTGFFEKKFQDKWKDSPFYLRLHHYWISHHTQIDCQIILRLDHIRPLNHPIRRIAYLTYLLKNSKSDNLWNQIYRIWQAETKFSQFKKEIFELIPNQENDYWNHHFSFEAIPKPQNLSFIGDDLKKVILINTILPLLYAEIKQSGDSKEWQRFQVLFSSLKSPANSKIKYLIHRFFGEKENALSKRSDFEQGAYQLHKDFCLHYEASCEGCPFVERYNSRLS